MLQDLILFNIYKASGKNLQVENTSSVVVTS